MRSAFTILPSIFLVAAAAAGAESLPRFKLSLRQPGIYGLTFEELRDAGLSAQAVASDGLALTHRGEPVPVWVADGGDGSFGPGDRLEFRGELLRGESSHLDEFTAWNVYILNLDGAGGARWAAGKSAEGGSEGCGLTPTGRLHLEEEKVRVRFHAGARPHQEIWFWEKLTYLDDPPFTLPLELDGLDTASPLSVSLEVGLRGWSRTHREHAGEFADHRIEVLVNGGKVGEGEWSNREDGFHLALPALPVELFRPGRNDLALRVPERVLPDGNALIDVVLLNWVEVEYPRTTLHEAARGRYHVDAPSGCLGLTAPGAGTLTAYAPDFRLEATASDLAIPIEEGPVSFDVVADGSLLPVGRIERDRPSTLRSGDRQADYVVIAHPKLLEAVKPLAQFHRRRGLAVEVVDVTDVYDEFHHGILHPRAIRDFLEYAHSSWRKPAPRFVLLVGDASWDARNAEVNDERYADWTFRLGRRKDFAGFLKNTSTPYPSKAGLNHRNLIPTWPEPTFQGNAASDNWFVAFGEDDEPLMALGRFPVTEAEEVSAIVAKTIQHATSRTVGAWSDNVLLITNESRKYQSRSDELAETLAGRGFEPTKIYPAASEATNELHTARMVERLAEGQFLVHFVGHGGRYIWRTGPPDLKKNHDLFSLEDLEEIPPGSPLSMVLSMSCYGAPFDHPNADSIGEKFLRLRERGAVGVIAASWRNTPTKLMSEVLLEELTRPGTIGEAFLRAKQRLPLGSFRAQYNLLGDPAAPIVLPPGVPTQRSETAPSPKEEARGGPSS